MATVLADGQRLTVDEYLATEETNRRYELVYGMVREPAAPSWDHQAIVARIFQRLEQHVTKRALGDVGLSPIDVVLDAQNHLIVQPDIIFVSPARSHIIRERLWGAPDLVVEVVSFGSRHYDRKIKREWYERYGVREQWTVDPVARTIEVSYFTDFPPSTIAFERNAVLRSHVLPRLRLSVGRIV